MLTRPIHKLATSVRDRPAVRGPARVPSGDTRLGSLILLGGTVRPTSLHTAIGRSLLDLPVEPGRSVLDLWCEQASGLAKVVGADTLQVQLAIDRRSCRPATPTTHPSLDVRVQRDPSDLRGTGGLVRDLAADCPMDGYLLVASAAQVLLDPLVSLAGMLFDAGADVALIAHQDGTPSSLMLIRRQCLELIPKIGFADMKEQSLPLIVEHYRVRVVQRKSAIGMPIRTLADYLAALHRYHSPRTIASQAGPFAEDWRPRFDVIEDGSVVEPGAKVLNSVVLCGGRVGRDAVVVRSLVCPGATVRPGQVVVDQLVTPRGQ